MSESATAESLRSGLKALNVPPQVLSRMWADTGSHLQQNGSTVDIDGASYDAMNCFVNAVLVQPTNVDAWRAIGDALQQRGDSRDDGDDSDEEDESDGDSPPAEVTIAGVTYTVVEARAKAVECEPKAVDLWLALGNALHANRTVVVSGKQVNALLCFASALTLDVAQPEAWFFCGEELAKRGASETCEILGKKYAAWQCAVEGLKRDPKGYPPAWLDLAKTLPKDMKTVLVGNARGHLSRTECVVTALQLDPENADAWQSLGLLLCEARLEGASDTATIDDVKVVAHDCFIRALELDPTLHDSWVALGNQLRLAGDEAQCTVASVDCSAVTCFAAALRLDEQNAAAWRGLAGALDSRETTVELKIESSPEPFEATPYSCLLRALELCPTEGTAWLDLARAMPTGGSATVGECQRSQIDCFAEACHLAPEEADCWFALGEALPTGGVVKVGERVFGQLRAFTECLRCDPKCAVAWANVGALMVPGTKSVVFEGDEGLSQVDCYVRALRIEPDNKSVWKLLGNALKGANTTADVFGDGKPLSYDDCVTKVGTL